MRVKCIDASPGRVSGRELLVAGCVYEVESVKGSGYYLSIDVARSWAIDRFVVVSDDACAQCGQVHS
jgi:hypothetical protein